MPRYQINEITETEIIADSAEEALDKHLTGENEGVVRYAVTERNIEEVDSA